jgi:hypothetical protein
MKSPTGSAGPVAPGRGGRRRGWGLVGGALVDFVGGGVGLMALEGEAVGVEVFDGPEDAGAEAGVGAGVPSDEEARGVGGGIPGGGPLAGDGEGFIVEGEAGGGSVIGAEGELIVDVRAAGGVEGGFPGADEAAGEEFAGVEEECGAGGAGEEEATEEEADEAAEEDAAGAVLADAEEGGDGGEKGGGMEGEDEPAEGPAVFDGAPVGGVAEGHVHDNCQDDGDDGGPEGELGGLDGKGVFGRREGRGAVVGLGHGRLRVRWTRYTKRQSAAMLTHRVQAGACGSAGKARGHADA